MAIINGIPGLKVTVKVEDQTAKEYDDPEMDDDDEQNNDDLHIVKPGLPRPHVVKYIEAKTDAAFAFSITRTPDFKHLADHVFFKVVVDGQRDKHIQSDHKSGKQITWHGKVNSLYSRDSNGNNYEHKFKFGNINVVEADLDCADLKVQVKQAENWGVLKVNCFHGRPSVKQHRYGYKARAAPTAVDEVSEKALKGKSLDCLAKFDSEPFLYNRTRPRLGTKYHDTMHRPFAVFEFRYRSRKGLIDEGIIPRPPPGDTVGDMSEDEVRRLARELLAERNRANPVKIGKEDKRGIKREGDSIDDAAFERRYKTRRSNTGHLEIDLTGDD